MSDSKLCARLSHHGGARYAKNSLRGSNRVLVPMTSDTDAFIAQIARTASTNSTNTEDLPVTINTAKFGVVGHREVNPIKQLEAARPAV